MKNVHDTHHVLWQKAKWNKGWMKLLREHEYLKVYIPRRTLHSYIHINMDEVPTMSGQHCRLVFTTLNTKILLGDYTFDDSLAKRLENLISIIPNEESKTKAALKKQLSIVQSFKRTR